MAMRKLITTILCWIIFILPGVASAFTGFVVKDVRLDGLQRISAGTVFSYLPVKVGDTIDSELAVQAIHALYQTGFFKDVRLEREDNVLVIFLAERPAIAKITFAGNDKIPTKQLEEALKQIGLAEGRVFDQSMLDNLELELKRQYNSFGKHNAAIKTAVTPLERNRVDISIKIAEGDEAKIYDLNIVGNKDFSDYELKRHLELAGRGFFGGRESYNKQLLQADLEALKSFYLDRGYINFNIDSTQVSLTPDRQDVYITVNVTEGERFTIRDVKLTGDLIVKPEEMKALLLLKRGNVFSRRDISESNKRISDKMAELGYAFANVNVIPEIDNDSRTVGLTLFVDPGKRIYVRRINISGNNKTRDEVIRREFRQMEGDWISTTSIARSRTRLDRLGFFEQVAIETPPVPGVPDQVDVNLNVSERSTGSLSAGLGFSDLNGVIVNFAVAQDNFLGTGKRMSISIDNSQVNNNYVFSYRDPYYTLNGVSRQFDVYYKTVDATSANITNYASNTAGAKVQYQFPLGEANSIWLGFGYEGTGLVTVSTTATEITDFIAKYGSTYNMLKAEGGWSYDTRNRAIFATDGSLSRVSFESALPGGDLEFTKYSLQHSRYFPLWGEQALSLNLQYGQSVGSTRTPDVPPFEYFFVGGSYTVRGYQPGSLSLNDSTGNPLGGVSQLVGNLEWILPNPFSENGNNTRLSVFYDTGYAFGADQSFSSDLLRASTGVALNWLTPVGALRFSWASPVNASSSDKLQSFQFTLGAPF